MSDENDPLIISDPNPKDGFSFPTLQEMAALLPQYEFHEVLGAGGMGAVYLARQPTLDRWVAIKLLPETASLNEEDAKRFIAEARSMARLTHAHIAAVHDFGQTPQGHLYLVLEYVPGLSLHQVIHGEGGVAAGQIRSIITQLCDALAYAHGHKVVHRDIKPANILITGDWQAKIIDFGLANDEDTAAAEVEYGTPDYVAPERLQANVQVDHRADIYSLGVVIHEMFTQLTPQAAGAAAGQGLPPEYASVVNRCMMPDPAQRFQSCAEIKTFLNAAVNIAPSFQAPAAPAPRPVPQRAQPRVSPASRSQSTYKQSSGIPGWIWAAACAAILGVAWRFVQQQNAPAQGTSMAQGGDAAGPAQPTASASVTQPSVVDSHAPAGPFSPEGGPFTLLKRLKGHKELVYASAILPDQRHALSGGHDDTLKLWDITTGTELKSFPSPVGDIHGLQVAMDGKRVLLYSFRSDQAAIFDLDEGKVIASIKAPTDRLTQAAWSGDQKSVYLLCNDTNGGVYHWEPARGAVLQQLPQWPRAAFQIFPLRGDAPGAPPQLLVLGSTMKPNPNPSAASNQPLIVDKPWAALFSVPDHQHVRDVEGYQNFRNRLSLSPDGSMLMGGLGALHILELPALTPLRSVNAPANAGCSASTWTGSGRLIASGYSDGSMAILDAQTGGRLSTINVGFRPNTISISQDEKWALVSGFPFDMTKPQEGDLDLVIVRLPNLTMLGSHEGFLSLAKRQLSSLHDLDPELAALRAQADAEALELTTRYGGALQRFAAAATAGGPEQQAMKAEADAIAQGRPVPDAATDASTTGEHKRLRGIYRQQIAQLQARRLNAPPALPEAVATSIKGLSFKRLQAGDRLGAVRCEALLSTLGRVKQAPAMVAATPTKTAASPAPKPAPVAPAPTPSPTAAPPAPPTGNNLAFGSHIKIEVSTSRPSKVKGGDFDDKMQVIQPRVKITNTSLNVGYEGYKAAFMLIGESAVDPKVIQVLQRQEFPLSLPPRLFVENECPSVTTQYDTTGAKFGFKYEGWVVQILGPGGEVVLTKSTAPSLEKLPEQVMQLKASMCYDRKLKTVPEPMLRF